MRRITIQPIIFTVLVGAFLASCGGTKGAQSGDKPSVVSYTKSLPKVTSSGQVVFTDGNVVNISDFQNPNASLFFIVRHAEKNTAAPDATADLTPEGWGRAVALANILREIPINRVFSTNIPRAKSTATPLRQGKHVELETYDREDPKPTLRQLVGQKGQRVFMVGHSNTVPQILNFLTNSSDYQNIPDDDYSRLYIVSSTGVGRSRVILVEF